ncbi:uncharacterized protein M421DRAFT_59878 [Didymella exigua CBS 183.55]|uniref:Uncharacterized protein n=1 Tax=Didymella exigua CBS 183.55 TaxID=1150837 RepID=A0A6A5RQC9_9PLEO|nr:uncharacterized protein M421DRAFT_59878 [Didymella exigua CBS 183.55]KAF1929530.1 hypothetical protein M421DRAFT_59878 [Didymella exigua CBS 183.55]
MFGPKLVTLLLSAAALAVAAGPQLDIAAIEAAGPPPQPTIATNAHDQKVSYDATSASAAAAATQSAQAFDTQTGPADGSTSDGSKVKRAVCDPQWTGKGPVPSPDTASAFLAYGPFASSANAAPTPTGYNLAFKNLQAGNNALGYMGFTLLDTYDTDLCASKCNEIYGCSAFNIAFERSPSKDPSPKGGACDQPPTTTFIKCVFWGGPVTIANAVNSGQYRNEYQVVIAGSNGYVNKSSDIVPGYGPGNYLDGKVIVAPNDCNDATTYIGNQYWNDGKPFDTARCAAACSAQTEANPATPCRFFNTYIINKNNQAQGQYCAMYTQQWDSSYAVSNQVTYDGAIYQTSYSYSYTVSDYSYTCVKNAFSCPNPGSCYTYQQCSNSNNGNCLCGTDTANNPLCHQPDSCGSPSCNTNSDCQSGYACLNANNCCGTSVCVAATVCVNKNSKRYIFSKRQNDSEVKMTNYIPPADAQKRDADDECTTVSCPNSPSA